MSKAIVLLGDRWGDFLWWCNHWFRLGYRRGYAYAGPFSRPLAHTANGTREPGIHHIISAISIESRSCWPPGRFNIVLAGRFFTNDACSLQCFNSSQTRH